MSERYEKTFPPEVWAAANFDEVNPHGNPVMPGLAMIDAWMKAWTREGKEDENARIVALIEAALVVWRGVDQEAVHGAEACLALIKGEQS